MSCGVGCSFGLDPALLWLWRRLAATAPIRTLAWEPPYAMGAGLEKAKKKSQKKKKTQSPNINTFVCHLYIYVSIYLSKEVCLSLQVELGREVERQRQRIPMVSIYSVSRKHFHIF